MGRPPLIGGRPFYFEANLYCVTTAALFQLLNTTTAAAVISKPKEITMEVTISGMTKQGGKPNKGGNRIVAFFDFEAPDIGMKGAALVVRADGSWDVWPPKIEDLTRAEIHERRKYVFWRGD